MAASKKQPEGDAAKPKSPAKKTTAAAKKPADVTAPKKAAPKKVAAKPAEPEPEPVQEPAAFADAGRPIPTYLTSPERSRLRRFVERMINR